MTQSLRRRISSEDCLKGELAACVAERNANKRMIQWEFTCKCARKKMKNHYPAVKSEYQPPEHF